MQWKACISVTGLYKATNLQKAGGGEKAKALKKGPLWYDGAGQGWVRFHSSWRGFAVSTGFLTSEHFTWKCGSGHHDLNIFLLLTASTLNKILLNRFYRSLYRRDFCNFWGIKCLNLMLLLFSFKICNMTCWVFLCFFFIFKKFLHSEIQPFYLRDFSA